MFIGRSSSRSRVALSISLYSQPETDRYTDAVLVAPASVGSPRREQAGQRRVVRTGALLGCSTHLIVIYSGANERH